MQETGLLRQWRDRIAEYRASGLTALQFCEHSGCSIGQLKYWITKINKLNVSDTAVSGWAQVDVADSECASGSGIIVRVGVLRIDVEPGFDKQVLAEVLRVASKC